MQRGSRGPLCLLSLCLIERAAPELSTTAQPCTSEKIFARSVADECGPLDRFAPTLDWTAVIGELFEARNAVFWAGAGAARDQLVALLALVGQSFELASQCPAAVAATSYSLAEVLAAESMDDNQRLRQLALIQFALAMLPTRAHEECTQWPLRGRDLAAAFRQLSTAVFPTFDKPPRPFPEPGVAVVTACAGLHLSGVRAGSRTNRRHYASKHGYDVHFFQDAKQILRAFPDTTNLTRTNAPAYWRAHALFSVMALPAQYSWLLWVDCDVVLTDLDMPVSELLARHGIWLDASGSWSASLLASSSGLGVDPEVLLLRKDPWGQQFLRNWTRLPSPSFLHPGRRMPSDERHPERLALQHNVLPHWGSWLQGQQASEWGSFQLKPEVRLAFGSLVSVARADAGRLKSRKTWVPGDFAWVDTECLGRQGLFEEAGCLKRHSEVTAEHG